MRPSTELSIAWPLVPGQVALLSPPSMSAGSTVENCLALQKGLRGRELPHLLAMFHLIVVDVSISIKGHQPCRVSRSLLSPTAPWVLRALLPVSAIFVQLDPVGDFFLCTFPVYFSSCFSRQESKDKDEPLCSPL